MELTVRFSKRELPKSNFHSKKTKDIIINSLLRDYKIVEDSKDNQLIQTFYPLLGKSISEKLDIPLTTVIVVVEKFLKSACYFKKFLSSCTIVWSHTSSNGITHFYLNHIFVWKKVLIFFSNNLYNINTCV
jgi:hypothetical protein